MRLEERIRKVSDEVNHTLSLVYMENDGSNLMSSSMGNLPSCFLFQI